MNFFHNHCGDYRKDKACRKPCAKVTIFRIGREPDGTFRSFIARGEALDMPQQFLGTSMVVRTENSAEKLVYDAVEARLSYDG